MKMLLLFAFITFLIFGIMVLRSFFIRVSQLYARSTKANTGSSSGNANGKDTEPRKVFRQEEGEYIKYEEL